MRKINFINTLVDIVQSVERQIVDLVVAGSSPVIHPIQKNCKCFAVFLILHYSLLFLHSTYPLNYGLDPQGVRSVEPDRTGVLPELR